jgi:hypothetical protein
LNAWGYVQKRKRPACFKKNSMKRTNYNFPIVEGKYKKGYFRFFYNSFKCKLLLFYQNSTDEYGGLKKKL